MFCPHCGSQQPEGSKFCAVCGRELQAPAAQATAQAPVVQVPAAQASTAQVPTSQAPATQSAPSAARTFPTAPTAHSQAGKALGRRSAVMIFAAVLALVFMFQAWFSFPFVNKFLNAAVASGAGGFTGMETAIVQSVSPSVTMPELFTLGNTVGSIADAGAQQVSLYSSYGATDSSLLQMQQMVSTFGTVSLVTKVLFALWVICIVALVVGVALRLFRGFDAVLFFALAGTAVVALVCTIGSFVLGGIVEGLISDMASYSSSSSSVNLTMSLLSPFMAPAYGAVVTIVLGAAGTLSSLVLKD